MCETEQMVISVTEAVGTVLSHDITEVNPVSGYKGARFRRGHVVSRADVEKLMDLGKEHLYVLQINEDQMHENDAAVMMAEAIAGTNANFKPDPREGKIDIAAEIGGVLKVNVEALERFNGVGAVMCATRHNNTVVAKGEVVAGTRAIPLVVDKKPVHDAVAIAEAAGGIVSVLPLRQARVALVITGNEVFSGRINDAFEPVVREKVAALGSAVVEVMKCPDDVEQIGAALARVRNNRADLVVMTGGMSVDPDDVTPLAARAAGADITAYGSAVLPGSMFMVGYFGDGTPVLGVPACGIHHPRTIFDLILPRVLAGETITSADIARLGHGGMCLDCPECRYPVCPFGKGC